MMVQWCIQNYCFIQSCVNSSARLAQIGQKSEGSVFVKHLALNCLNRAQQRMKLCERVKATAEAELNCLKHDTVLVSDTQLWDWVVPSDSGSPAGEA